MSRRKPETISERATPIPPIYSGAISNRAPQPFGDLPDHVAEQQQCRRPDQRRYEIGELEMPVRHLEYSGCERHRGAQRTEKSSNEDAGGAPFFYEGFAARQYFRIARQRPHLRDVF